MSDKKMPEGMIKFQAELENKVRDKGTEQANLDCEECGTKILLVGPGLVSMHVFVYPDAPYHTTKALCYSCMNKALQKHGGKSMSAPLTDTMSKNSGIIYDLGGGRYGVALHKEQLPAFSNFKKVYLHVFTDALCTITEIDPKTRKKHVTLKHISEIKPIGFSD